MLNRRLFLQQLGALAAAGAAPNARPLNVVFILADDLGWTDLTSYGSKFYETPNIDKLAASGVKFTNAYAACPVCSPTRASIMTGKYPARLGITNYLPGAHPTPYSKLIGTTPKQQLPIEEVTIADAFKSAGYATGQFGKWHLGGPGFGPDKQGFDFVFSPERAAGNYFYPGWRTSGNKTFEGKPGEYITDRLGQEVSDFIIRHKEKPFFAYLPQFAPHVPLEAKKDMIDKYAAKIRSGARHNDPIYAAMIQSLDESVGRIVSTLEQNNLSSNTLVVFTSDNGGLSAPEWKLKPTTSNWPLREGKGHLYEGGIRVPLIVSGPGVRRAAIDHTPISSIDHFATLAELTGLSSTPKMDGISYASLLKSKHRLRSRPLFWHYPHYSNQLGRPGSAVRLDNFKLIRFHEDNHEELYNLSADLGEQYDIASSNPTKVAELRQLLDRWLQDTKAEFPTPNPKYDAVREAEGYWWKQAGAYERFGKQ